MNNCVPNLNYAQGIVRVCPNFCVNGGLGYSCGMLNGKASQRSLPIPNRHGPLLAEVPQGQVEQFQ